MVEGYISRDFSRRPTLGVGSKRELATYPLASKKMRHGRLFWHFLFITISARPSYRFPLCITELPVFPQVVRSRATSGCIIVFEKRLNASPC